MSTSGPQESIITPEGVALRFQTAAASERLVALTIDLLLMLVILLVVGFGLALLQAGTAAIALLFFGLRQFWFVWFETRWNGSTPGKSRFQLRVIRADGGPLTTEILFARNLTREIELFLPMILLLQPDALFAGQEGLTRLLASLWVLLLLFFPLTNPHRLRIGDLLAGTRVVVSPRLSLLKDLAAEANRPAGSAVAPEFVFTEAQLSIYGLQELNVLEDVLRKARTAGTDETVQAVCRSIGKRIGWADTSVAAHKALPFLLAFYAAQRARLEQGLLMGKRRERKVSR